MRVITGTGRCGTTYTSRLLCLAGVACGHEDIYGARGVTGRWDLTAESSWIAAGHLPLPHAAHQVRHPLRVIRSFASVGLFSEPRYRPQLEFIERIIGELPADPLEAAARYWIDWTAHIDRHVDLWWRVEDLPLPALAEFTGADLRVLWRVSRDLPRDITCGRYGRISEPQADLDSLPDDLWAELVEAGARYGYEVAR